MKKKSKLLFFLYKIVMFWYKKLHMWRIPVPGKEKVKADLSQMHPGENSRECVTDYYVAKLSVSIAVLLVGILLSVALHYGEKGKNVIEDEWMYRGSDETGMQLYDITGQVEEGEKYSFHVEVAPRRYKETELQTWYRQFGEQLPELILGKNTSPDSVSSDLELYEQYSGFPFSVEWTSELPEIIDENGRVSQPQTKTAVRLEAEIAYGDFYRKTEVVVSVAAKDLSEAESEKQQIEELLLQAQEKDPENEKILLPTEINGKRISWTETAAKTGWKILTGAMVAAVLIFFFQDKDLHDLVEKKKREERRSYPEILQKLTLYLEAGMTVRTAFCRIADAYEKERELGGKRQEAYEEMLIAARELRMGVSEAAAYENFGRRTGVREYLRLSTFLVQNLKKGSSFLLQQLKEEARQAETMRLQNARKLSEEATTKLLLPMVMLLVIVMVIIMVPAFSNAGV